MKRPKSLKRSQISKQKYSALFKMANNIATELYYKEKEANTLDGRKRYNFMKEAFAIARLSKIKVNTEDLPIIKYNDFKNSVLVNHPNGSDGWWVSNNVDALKGSEGEWHDVDLRMYKKFVDGSYEDKDGKIIEEKTTTILKEALYTAQRKSWHGQYAFNVPNYKPFAYIEDYDIFVYTDLYDALTAEELTIFEEYVVGIK